MKAARMLIRVASNIRLEGKSKGVMKSKIVKGMMNTFHNS